MLTITGNITKMDAYPIFSTYGEIGEDGGSSWSAEPFIKYPKYNYGDDAHSYLRS